MTAGHRKPPIVFSHANGFPAGTYRVLFERWESEGHDVHAIDKFGHDPRYPVTSNWPRLADQLIDFIEGERCAPAVLVGHSLGGLLSLMAACKRPALASGLVLLDSPLIRGWRAQSVRLAKATGLMPRYSPGRIARGRRDEWLSREEAYEHYAAKEKFARWDVRVLRDYIAAGTQLHKGRARLAFGRDVETRIYDTLPHDLGRLMRRHSPRCPVGFIAGTESTEIRQGGIAASKALAGERFVWVEGSHLYPMERPDVTATLVMRLIDSFPRPEQPIDADSAARAPARPAATRPV